MRPIVINGTVLRGSITGIPRYVYEVVTRLDALLAGSDLDVRIAYRNDGQPVCLPPLQNIRVVPLRAIRYDYNLAVLPYYLRRNRAFFVGLASDVVLQRRSAVVLHDIRPLVLPGDRPAFRFKFWFHCLTIRCFAAHLFTDSGDQRALIARKLHIDPARIAVTWAGWEHMQAVTPDEGIFQKLPGVRRGDYFYALGSLAAHKNYKWVREVAARNPDKTFVVAGGKDLTTFRDDAKAHNTANIFYPGYVSDGENKALMQNCKAFLHPAVFEGFGIPPLEALSCGARILLSNASCLPELYGDCAAYFDPYDYDVDLDALLRTPTAPPDRLLETYSWDRAAAFWLAEFEKYARS